MQVVRGTFRAAGSDELVEAGFSVDDWEKRRQQPGLDAYLQKVAWPKLTGMLGEGWVQVGEWAAQGAY